MLKIHICLFVYILDAKSRDENKKIPEVKKAGMPSFIYSPPPSSPTDEAPFPLGMPMSSVFSKVSTPPSITAASPFGKDATKILDPTKIKLILLIRAEIS